MRNSLKSIDETIDRIMTAWLFNDVAFAIVPIATMAIINQLLGDSFKDFLFIKEWSFATIVFFGVAIRKFVRLKVQIQKLPKSHKLDAGISAYIVLLIASVLVLSFVILAEKGVLARQQRQLLGTTQLSLFVSGLAVILISVIAEEAVRREETEFPDGMSKRQFLSHILSRIEQASESFDHVGFAMERSAVMKFESSKYMKEDETALNSAIAHLEQTLSDGKRNLDLLKALRGPATAAAAAAAGASVIS